MSLGKSICTPMITVTPIKRSHQFSLQEILAQQECSLYEGRISHEHMKFANILAQEICQYIVSSMQSICLAQFPITNKHYQQRCWRLIPDILANQENNGW